MSCKLSKNCGRYSLDETAISNFPTSGKSNHSERIVTNHSVGNRNSNGMSDMTLFMKTTNSARKIKDENQKIEVRWILNCGSSSPPHRLTGARSQEP